MSLAGRVGLAAAAELERTVGPYIALASYRRLVSLLDDPRGRGLAAVGALRCALALGEIDELCEVARAYAEAGAPSNLPAIVPLCTALVGRGRADAAVLLAAAEAKRTPLSRALYLEARCHAHAGDRAASLRACARAAERAEAEGADDVLVAARVRLVEAGMIEPALGASAGGGVDPARATPAQKLVLARARLAAPSRFTRASGLSLLKELADEGDEAVARAAVRTAAEHADAMGEALTPLEADRLAAALQRWPEEHEREDALARLAALVRIAGASGAERERALIEAAAIAPELAHQHARTRAILQGASEDGGGEREGAPALRVAWAALDAIAAERAGAAGAVAALRTIRDLVAQRAAAPSAPAWSAARIGLLSKDPAVGAAAADAARSLASASRGPGPPGGRLALAGVARRAGAGDLALALLRAAAASREAGAQEALARARLCDGWALAGRGERDPALEALREARELGA